MSVPSSNLILQRVNAGSSEPFQFDSLALMHMLKDGFANVQTIRAFFSSDLRFRPLLRFGHPYLARLDTQDEIDEVKIRFTRALDMANAVIFPPSRCASSS